MKIKICGLSDAAAVQAAVHAGVDAIGFVFAPSPRQVTPAQARALCRDVPATVARVAVTQHPTLGLLKEILEEFDPDCLQSDAADFKELEVRRGPRLLPVYREGVSEPGLFTRRAEQPGVAFEPDFLYEGAVSGRGETVDWEQAARLGRRGRMLLAGGLNATNVAAAILRARPYGVDVSSGVESAPGVKDIARISEFVSAVRKIEVQHEEDLIQ